MSTTITRWVGATALFLFVAWLDQRYGHAVALTTLLAALLVVAIWGGSGRYRSAGHDGRSDVGRQAARGTTDDQAAGNALGTADGTATEGSAREDRP